MTYDDFWHGDVSMVRAYRKAEEMRRRKQNEILWLQGLYVRDALICTVGNMFSGKSGTKNEYPKEPYPITETDVLERKERDARLAEERIKANFAAFAAQMMKKMPKEAHPVKEGGEINVRDD